MDPFLYKPIFLHIVVLLSILSINKPMEDNLQIPAKSDEGNKIFLWSLFFIFFLGLRPVSFIFGDTGNYARTYEAMSIQNFEISSFSSDVAFYSVMSWFAKSGLDISIWLLYIEFFYIFGSAYAVYKLFTNGSNIAFAVVLASFSFFSYATNGLRNGMACGLFLLALPFIKEKKWIIAGVLCLFAFNVHSSIFLPIFAISLAHFYKNTKMYFWGWLICIGLSIIAGGFWENFIINQDLVDTGKDASYYSNETVDMSLFSKRGFRYDFLLYSCVPILMGYYFVVKKNYEDNWYKIILNTYITCNSIWVLVNQNWLSNRIAYLSWFMYGFVMMYPLLMNPHVQYRSKWIRYTVIGNAGFSYFMWIIGKYV